MAVLPESDAEQRNGWVALEKNFQSLRRPLVALAERLMSDRGELACEAEDVVHSAYAQALEKPGLFAGKTVPGVLRLMRGFVRRQYKRERRDVMRQRRDARKTMPLDSLSSEELAELTAPEPSPADLALVKERCERVLASFRKLTEIQQAVLVLVFLRGMRLREASDFLCLSERAVDKHRERALTKLEALLTNEL